MRFGRGVAMAAVPVVSTITVVVFIVVMFIVVVFIVLFASSFRACVSVAGSAQT